MAEDLVDLAEALERADFLDEAIDLGEAFASEEKRAKGSKEWGAERH